MAKVAPDSYEQESFEVTEYGEEHKCRDVRARIAQIIKDREQEAPSIGIGVTFVGPLMKLWYQTYEFAMPLRKREIDERAWKAIDEALKYIKKQLGKDAPEFKNKKELENHSVMKVSMNERFLATYWKFYSL